MTTTRIQCLAVISSANSPLYIRSFGPQDTRQASLRYQFIAHSALDVVDERTTGSAEQYLGLLLTLEDLAVYGFQTATKTKFLVMLTMSDMVVKDLDMITIFRAMHTSYLSHICNPFHTIAPSLLSNKATSAPLSASEANLPPSKRPIQSPLFEKRMEKIAGWPPATSAVVGSHGTAGPAVPAKDLGAPPPAAKA